ncbi:MAG: AAA family ATPase [Pelotomaculum sp.]|nr:AAA family ATPase [Pelotomaculum sp.]
MKKISLPGTTLLVLCGPPGCGKSTFALRYFKDTMIVSSDRCRALVSDYEENMAASREAFRLFHYTIERRLSLGRFTVADSTAIARQARRELLRIGRKYGFNVTLLVFNIPLDVCLERNTGRERRVIRPVIIKASKKLRHIIDGAFSEGFDDVYVVTDEDLNDPFFKIEILRHVLTLPGPFDIIGDVHGCYGELVLLLARLGYRRQFNYHAHPSGRKAVFLGDIAGPGPRSIDSFWLAKAMVDSGNAFYVPGDYCRRLCRYLAGKEGESRQGLEKVLDEVEALPEDKRSYFREEFLRLIRNAPPYLILDRGRLVVSHAGIRADITGKVTEQVENFCLFGETRGETIEQGLPAIPHWVGEYRGEALVVCGHNPVSKAGFINNTISLDRGCAIGGLTALRYPEREIVQVPSLTACSRAELRMDLY